MRKTFKILALMLIITMTYQFAPITAKASSEPFIGEVMLFAGNFAPKGWMKCEGQLLAIRENTALFSIIGTTYGGDGKDTFALPDLRGRVPIGAGQGEGLAYRVLGEIGGEENVTLSSSELPPHNHLVSSFKAEVTGSGSLKANNILGDSSIPGNNVLAKGLRNERIYSNDTLATRVNMKSGAIEFNKTYNINTNVAPSGGSQSHNNMAPYLALNYCIAVQGIFPSRNDNPLSGGNVIGEIKMFAGSYTPSGYYPCNGQAVNRSANTPLFNLIGVTYGSDDELTFKLPDLRGRTPIGTGAGPGLTNRSLGEMGGTEGESLSINSMSAHGHNIFSKTNQYNESGTLNCSTESGNTPVPENNVLAKGVRNERIYSTTSAINMKANEVDMSLTGTVTSQGSTDGSGGGQPHNNMMPYLGINYIISGSGELPSPDSPLGYESYDEPYLSEIRMFAFAFVPSNFAKCEGQTNVILENNALFALIGRTYGGDGTYDFKLPDLRGRSAIGEGPFYTQGEMFGREFEFLTAYQIPEHYHELTLSTTITGTGTLKGTNATGNTNTPENNTLAKGFKNERIYSTSNSTLKLEDKVDLNLSIKILPTDSNGDAVESVYTEITGSSSAHNNMQPFTAINYAICLSGIFPSRP